MASAKEPAAKPGDRLVMVSKTKRLSPVQRAGVIEEVLSQDPARFLVRWGDDRTSVLAPLAGSYRIERPGAKATKSPFEKKQSYKPVKPSAERIRYGSAQKRRKLKKG